MSHGFPTILIVGKTNVSSFILCGRTIFFVTFTVFFWRAIANLTPFFALALVNGQFNLKLVVTFCILSQRFLSLRVEGHLRSKHRSQTTQTEKLCLRYERNELTHHFSTRFGGDWCV